MNDRLLAGIILIFLAILWVFVVTWDSHKTIEEKEWERETFSDSTLLLSGVAILFVIFFPAYLLWSKGMALIDKGDFNAKP